MNLSTLTTTTRPAAPRSAQRRVRLVPSDDGWTLLTTDGQLVHRGLGYQARRECLRFARDAGFLAIER